MKLLTLRKLHKWCAIFVGLQLLLWTISGTIFAWLQHRDVDGEHLVSELQPVAIDAQALAEPARWRDPLDSGEIRDLSLMRLQGTWVYRIEQEGGTVLRRAIDGAAVRVDEPMVRALVTARYRGEGHLAEVIRRPRATLETRGLGDTWQARFDDDNRTSLYFSAADGTLVAIRTDAWRIFDFFWMLHTMDYTGRDNFNNPLVVLAASAGLWTALTGLYLLARVFRWQT